jgi:predicted Zn-dependent peptidase
MAVCMSGDFDPDATIALIDKYFGDLRPNPDLPKLHVTEEAEIVQPIVKEVLGLDAENIALAWRFPGAANKDTEILQVVSSILYNGRAGLIDLDLTQQQKTLGAAAYANIMADYSALIMQGRPKQGQTLEEVKDLLLGEVKKLREGDFDEKMLQAIINNFKLSILQNNEYNDARADWFVQSFVNGTSWDDEVTMIDRVSKLTKEEIVAFANKYLKDNNLAIVYKRQGKDPNEMKIAKPTITPIVMNRDSTSAFLRSIQMSNVTPIEPVFTDYDKDMTRLTGKADIPVLYKQNTSNDLFEMYYLFDTGRNNDKALSTALAYLKYLGTSDMTAGEIQSELYRLACSFNVSTGSFMTTVSLSGLAENMPAAMKLLEKLLGDAQVDKEAYANYVNDLIKSRHDAKLNQSQNFSALLSYAMYGPQSPTTNILSEAELKSMNPQTLVDKVHHLDSYQHRILYYGPHSTQQLLDMLSAEHQTPDVLTPVSTENKFPLLLTSETKVYIAPYDARQIYMAQLSNKDDKYDPNMQPAITLYNEYFGGGMNSVVFQEMRERRGLAYSANARMVSPSYKDTPYYFQTQIATQNDKMMDAINAFNDIINNMPVSEPAFKLAKDGLLARLRTERETKSNILWSYVYAQYLGLNADPRIKLYNDVQSMTLDDVIDFQSKWVKGRTYTYAILGDKKDLDMDALRKIGPVVELTTKDIFGY